MEIPPELNNVTTNMTKELLSEFDLADFDWNSTQFQDFLHDTEAQLLLSIALHIAGVCADFILIYIGFFKPQYRKWPNVLLANWAIANLLHLINMPIVAKVLPILQRKEQMGLLYCVLSQSVDICKCSEIMFLLILLGNWYVSVYYQETHTRLSEFLKIVVISLWFISFCVIPVTVGSCMLETYGAPMYLFDLFYIVMGTLLIKVHASMIFQTYRKRAEFEHPTLVLNLVSLFVFIWGPNVLETFFNRNLVLPLVTDWLDAISPVFVVAVLFGFEKDFKQYAGKLVRRLRARRKVKPAPAELKPTGKVVEVEPTSKIEVEPTSKVEVA